MGSIKKRGNYGENGSLNWGLGIEDNQIRSSGIICNPDFFPDDVLPKNASPIRCIYNRR